LLFAIIEQEDEAYKITENILENMCIPLEYTFPLFAL